METADILLNDLFEQEEEVTEGEVGSGFSFDSEDGDDMELDNDPFDDNDPL